MRCWPGCEPPARQCRYYRLGWGQDWESAGRDEGVMRERGGGGTELEGGGDGGDGSK